MLLLPVAPAHAAPADAYWVGNGGNWTDAATHWAVISGGAPGAGNLPDGTTNVHFDGASFILAGQTVTVDVNSACGDMDWAGAANTPALALGGNLLSIYGSAAFIAGMTIPTGGQFRFSGAGVMALTTAGLTLPGQIVVNAAGTLSLQDSLTVGTLISLEKGTFATNNLVVTTPIWGFGTAADAKTLTLGSSIVNITGQTGWSYTSSNLVVTPNTATIKLTGIASFSGGGVTTYNEVQCLGTSHAFSGNNTVATLTTDSTKTQFLYFADGSIQTVGTATLSGSVGHYHYLRGSGITGWNIVKAGGGTVTANYCEINRSAASPVTTWYYDVTKTVVTNSTGWISTGSGSPPVVSPFQDYNEAQPVVYPAMAGAWSNGMSDTCSVIKVGATYHIYWQGCTVAGITAFKIGHATSADGKTWIVDPANPVITNNDTYKNEAVWNPWVIYDASEPTAYKYKMWYGSENIGYVDFSFNYAYSVDGSTWTDSASNPLYTHPSDIIEDPTVVYNSALGQWVAYWFDWDTLTSRRAVGTTETNIDFAHSTAFTISGATAPYFGYGVWNDGSVWCMTYTERPGSYQPNWIQVGLAVSSDGLTWTAVNTNLWVGQESRITKVGTGSYYLYYSKPGFYDATGCNIGLATLSTSILPTVTTATATGVDYATTTHATLNGAVPNMGAVSSTSVRFNWGYSAAASDFQTASQAVTTPGSATAAVVGFTPGATVYYRTVSTVGGIVSYGAVSSFSTSTSGSGGTRSNTVSYILISELAPIAVAVGVCISAFLLFKGGGFVGAVINIALGLVAYAVIQVLVNVLF